MSLGVPLKPNTFFHLYLSGSYHHRLFKAATDYEQFLQQYSRHIAPVAETYAYCLLPNHFHFFFRIRTLREQIKRWLEDDDHITPFRPLFATEQFAHLWQTWGPTGNALSRSITCVQVTQRQQFPALIRYIHQNPTLHRQCDNFRAWRWSSYQALLANAPTQIPVEIVMRWFYGADWFEELHWEPQDVAQLGYLIVED